mmetsp:Transcript_14289/g.21740  ORF Transcript_14289/g.21740 Transcript_14289/m.21740 type:complete len:216 (-) Transcript_14289:164-811(-)
MDESEVAPVNLFIEPQSVDHLHISTSYGINVEVLSSCQAIPACVHCKNQVHPQVVPGGVQAPHVLRRQRRHVLPRRHVLVVEDLEEQRGVPGTAGHRLLQPRVPVRVLPRLEGPGRTAGHGVQCVRHQRQEALRRHLPLLRPDPAAAAAGGAARLVLKEVQVGVDDPGPCIQVTVATKCLLDDVQDVDGPEHAPRVLVHHRQVVALVAVHAAQGV